MPRREREKEKNFESAFEKLPPQNIEAEEALLGSLLIDKESIVIIADRIEPEDFYKDIHQMIYQAMLEVWEKSEPIDILSVGNRLEEKKQLKTIGGRSYLASLANSVPSSSHINSYAQIVKKKSTLRKLIRSSTETIQIAYQEEDDTAEILDRAEQKIFSISQKYLKQKFVPLKDTLAQAFERIDELHKGEKIMRGIPTGFTDLDNVLAGLQPSELIILAARPSIGKSALALDIARQAAVYQKIPVGIFSLEMSKEQISDRIICSQANVSLWKLRTGHLSKKDDDGDFEKLGQTLGVLAEAPIFIDDSPMATPIEIRTKARRLQAEHGLGLLILDYLQLMEGGSGSNEGRVQEVSQISRSLKAIARELNIPVLAISQLSRAPEARTPSIPRLADLRESGCLTGDTLITRADTGERVAIKDLVQREKQEKIPVLAVDKDYKIKPCSMTKAFSSGKKKVFELKTRSGRKIKASANHPFLKQGDGWTELDKLNIGNYLALPKLPYKKSKNFLTSDIFWDKIVSIKELGVEEVYDATVEGVHNFVANDIIVHNSLEQDSDVVIFIYRKSMDRSIKRCPEHEKNIAEIYIGKHRHGPAGVMIPLYFDNNTASFRNLEKKMDNLDFTDEEETTELPF